MLIVLKGLRVKLGEEVVSMLLNVIDVPMPVSLLILESIDTVEMSSMLDTGVKELGIPVPLTDPVLLSSLLLV